MRSARFPGTEAGRPLVYEGTMTADAARYFRKGFGLGAEVKEALASDYAGRLVDLLVERDYRLEAAGVTVQIAREFGFCYGVERAVDYAYQARRRYPDRRIFLAGEIIHNPHVNAKLRDMGIEFLKSGEAGFDFSPVSPEDVVILPAFGVTISDAETLRTKLGCIVVDTTCGSVLNVWKRVESYAKDGFTSLIHGKYYHEETRSTASQASRHPGGTYLVVRNMEQARDVCDYIEGAGLAREAFMEKYREQASAHFDPDRHLQRIGVANQTTMLARESLAIAKEVGLAMERRFGAEHRAEHFRSFDTICSATQDRQDAVNRLLEEPLDMMVVIGGYNSSNTMSLAAICARKVPTFHISDASCIDPEADSIRHLPVGAKAEVTVDLWLPDSGAVRIGLTAGASTPNNKIGETIARIFATRGVDPATIG
ncbi:MAG: 4-hydroxy-3-methylbut-2-enyl diphosphate reductase [Gemmatimonadaceae bacterium]|nr:4-hydroxy-3-methylbut-2-enyl diphosphate reductase [Gemmatimonadaceae bacterium]